MGKLKNYEWTPLTDTITVCIEELHKIGVDVEVAYDLLVETAIRYHRDVIGFDPFFIRGNVRHQMGIRFPSKIKEW